MPWSPIKKSYATWTVPPNLLDYDSTCATFSWEAARRELDGLPGGTGLNMAHEAVDRHAHGPRRNHLALRWIGRDGTIREFTYGDVQAHSNRFANVLRQLGVTKGERVFALAGRIPALYIAALGTLKNTSVFCPLFAAFGPEPVYQRLHRGDAKVIVTTTRLYEQKVAGLQQRLPHLQHVLLADADDDLGKEVESALMEHPAVAEAGVIGKPDPLIGELVKAFVTLKPHVQPSESLRLELLGFAR